MKKLLTAFLAVTMLIALMGFTAFAQNTETMVAKVNGVEYTDLQSALDTAVAGMGNVTVEILSDIDLSGADWNPVTVSASGYPMVTVNGNEHTITGLNDMLFSGTWAGKSGLVINDLTIKDSNIENDVNDEKGTVGVGAFIGFPQASATITLNNCHLIDSTVKGGHWTGGLIGMAGGYNGNDGPVFMNLTITDCSVTGSTLTGKGSVGGVIGHGSCNAWTNVVIKDATVSGNTITSTGSSTNKAGSVMGTIGAAGQETTAAGETKTGGATVSATVSGNTVTSNGTTITTIYGRQGTATGVLAVNGGTYDSYPIEENVSYASPAEGYVIAQNDDGTYGITEAPTGTITHGYTSTHIWGEASGNAKESFVIKVFSNETLIATTSLNNIGGIIDGDVYVTWNAYIGEHTDSYWTTVWEKGNPVANLQPTKVELYVDGVKVAENSVQMNCPDNLNPVNWADVPGVAGIFVADTDAGFYVESDTKYGMVRFLFKADLAEEITVDSFGIKYNMASDITKEVTSDNKTVSESGDKKAFYGDLVGIGENTNDTYYAIGFVKVGETTYWSNVVFCKPDLTKDFTGNMGGNN